MLETTGKPQSSAQAPELSTGGAPPSGTARPPASWQSSAGLNATNFFLAEVVGVVIPFVNTLLAERGWSYSAIGRATALAGLGVFVMQTPAGIIVDRVTARRGLLAVAALVLGGCYALLPLVPASEWSVDPLMFGSGVAQAFFAPLLAALALSLVGQARLTKTIGWNQGWNHAGNIAAALSAMLVIKWFAVEGVFFAVAATSVLAALSVFAIRSTELDPGLSRRDQTGTVRELFADQRVIVLLVATGLFHLANAPVMPLVALYVKDLQGTDSQVAQVILVAQFVMVPVSLAAGWLCSRWGRKPTFAVGFVVLPVRIFLYSQCSSPGSLVALQSLDGIGAGIYGVAIVAICADLTRGKRGFNTLMGMVATALAIGGVIGPILAGLLVDRLGFALAFDVFALIGVAAATVFVVLMPETAPSAQDGTRQPKAA
jgi:MFS family permease